jgi:hypothetical protein
METAAWVAANTPLGWYSYVKSVGWQDGLVPYEEAALPEITALKVPGLQVGPVHYTYYFVVDSNGDGVADEQWIDQVEVDVTRWR